MLPTPLVLVVSSEPPPGAVFTCVPCLPAVEGGEGCPSH